MSNALEMKQKLKEKYRRPIEITTYNRQSFVENISDIRSGFNALKSMSDERINIINDLKKEIVDKDILLKELETKFNEKVIKMELDEEMYEKFQAHTKVAKNLVVENNQIITENQELTRERNDYKHMYEIFTKYHKKKMRQAITAGLQL